MEKVIQILMRRDGLSHGEAEEIIRSCLHTIYMNLDDPCECEEIWMEETGLEVDYLMEVLT